ncbi:LysR substrate-binding domain-containing protein [Streptomyces sp. NPDC056723]|uniref:LysR substrate-binding domain-containing protein n=1 Tax=Streptomyces sp. NPDC056723 TaxID=3345925 RepID=UPI003687AACF
MERTRVSEGGHSACGHVNATVAHGRWNNEGRRAPRHNTVLRPGEEIRPQVADRDSKGFQRRAEKHGRRSRPSPRAAYPRGAGLPHRGPPAPAPVGARCARRPPGVRGRGRELGRRVHRGGRPLGPRPFAQGRLARRARGGGRAAQAGHPRRLQALVESSLDQGIVRLPVSSPELSSRTVAREPFVAALPAARQPATRQGSVHIREFDGHVLLMYAPAWAAASAPGSQSSRHPADLGATSRAAAR